MHCLFDVSIAKRFMRLDALSFEKYDEKKKKNYQRTAY